MFIPPPTHCGVTWLCGGSSAQAYPAELCSISDAELTLVLMHFLLNIELLFSGG
jgi:hypothetical protein